MRTKEIIIENAIKDTSGNILLGYGLHRNESIARYDI